jgi:transposase
MPGPAPRKVDRPVRDDPPPALHSFANGLRKDHDAVLLGLTLPYTLEGKNYKMIKRRMFGRAALPLLRRRVLLTAREGG